MKKIIPLLFVSILISCSSKEPKENKDMYKSHFGEINISIIDSLIFNSAYIKLDKFQGKDNVELEAFRILADSLDKRKLNINDFFIFAVKQESDTIVTFELDHIDYLVYSYKREKIDAIPITGNVTGYMGWYRVNIKNKKLNITLGQ